jgi:hypothetical protein
LVTCATIIKDISLGPLKTTLAADSDVANAILSHVADGSASLLQSLATRNQWALSLVLIPTDVPPLLFFFYATGSLDDEIIINAFPSIFDGPIKREDNCAARLEARRIKVGEVNAEAAIFRRRILDSLPAV